MPVPAVIGGLIATLGGVLKLAENPFIAWFLVVGVLFLDSIGSGLAGFQGVFGYILMELISAFSGGSINIVITSFQLMILVAMTPIVLFAISKSRILTHR